LVVVGELPVRTFVTMQLAVSRQTPNGLFLPCGDVPSSQSFPSVLAELKARELPIQTSLERGSVLPHKPPACGRAEIL
jgi:hypothetical protein